MKWTRTTALAAAAVLAYAPAALADWQAYSSKAYGFSMLVPQGTKVAEKEFEGGWAGMYAAVEGVELYGLAKLGTQATAPEIEAFAVKFSGIPAKYWKQVEKGANVNGWKWYQTVKASDGNHLVYGIYGTGPKGSYLLFLKTTEDDFAENEADYLKWYSSLKLQ